MDSHIHESALPFCTTCCQSSVNLVTLSFGGGPLVTHLRQMLLDRLSRLKFCYLTVRRQSQLMTHVAMLIGEQLFRLIRPIDAHYNWYSGGRWYARRTRYNRRRRRLNSSNSSYCCVRYAKEAMIREIRQGSHQNDQVIHFQSDKTYEVGQKSMNLPKPIHKSA
jgi:hypothetical protein